MVLGIITAIAACPAIVGTTEAVRQGQRSNAKEKHRGTKTNLIANCASVSRKSGQIDGGAVVLNNNKLYVESPPASTHSDEQTQTQSQSFHPFAGYFLPYPEQEWGRKGEGLVSTIMDDPPQLNWIYVDKDTYEIKYGNRLESEDHIVGPWDCTKIDKRLTLDGWEGFMAVEVGHRLWALYFDEDDDGLKDKVSKKRILEIELSRKERRNMKGDDEEG